MTCDPCCTLRDRIDVRNVESYSILSEYDEETNHVWIGNDVRFDPFVSSKISSFPHSNKRYGSYLRKLIEMNFINTHDSWLVSCPTFFEIIEINVHHLHSYKYLSDKIYVLSLEHVFEVTSSCIWISDVWDSTSFRQSHSWNSEYQSKWMRRLAWYHGSRHNRYTRHPITRTLFTFMCSSYIQSRQYLFM